MPLAGRESWFALKGGSAINLFIRDLPRLSVDLDLTYLPIKDRKESLEEIDLSLKRIAKSVEKSLPDVNVRQAGFVEKMATKLIFSRAGEIVKMETSPVLRDTIGEPEVRGVCPEIEKQFGYSEMLIVHSHDLFAGKLCAAIDRQHPRDLFDVKLLLENEGIGDDLLKVFIVYLISGNRPIAEMLDPQMQPLKDVFETQFRGMALHNVGVEELEETRNRLVKLIQDRLSDDDRKFLISFKKGEPEWTLFSIPEAQHLPAVKWKLMNIGRMTKAKHASAVKNLEKVLFKQVKVILENT
ncbi:MAG: nucleotidyl transferase AbiEii/AbiGii toxin family protein [Desulfobacteraceae bacterium]|nr:nucleotidyl transferase AbiEii/AbiGii toxin family protein [Desulfobacteraceae bacterium]